MNSDINNIPKTQTSQKFAKSYSYIKHTMLVTMIQCTQEGSTEGIRWIHASYNYISCWVMPRLSVYGKSLSNKTLTRIGFLEMIMALFFDSTSSVRCTQTRTVWRRKRMWCLIWWSNTNTLLINNHAYILHQFTVKHRIQSLGCIYSLATLEWLLRLAESRGSLPEQYTVCEVIGF